ncbi:MAG: O-antigen ligase family protein [Bdellovibrionota bacterium]
MTNNSAFSKHLKSAIPALLIFFIISIPNIFFAHTARNLSYDIQSFVISIFITGFIFYYISAGKYKEFDLSISGKDLWLLGFLILVLISFILVNDHLASLQTVIWWIEASIFYFFSKSVLRNQNIRDCLFLLLIISGVFASILFGFSLIEASYVNKDFIIFPYALNRNFAAQVFILPFFISLSFIFGSHAKKIKIFAASSCLIIFLGIILSRSRAVWLGLALASLFIITYEFFNRKKSTHKIKFKNLLRILACTFGLTLLLGLLADFILPTFNLPSPLTTLETLKNPLAGSAGGRIHRWVNALPMIRDHLFFGVGPGNWANTFFKYRDGIFVDAEGFPHSYSCYFDILGEFGIFAFVAFLAFLLSFFRRNYLTSSRTLFLKAAFLTFAFSIAFHMSFSIKILLIMFFLTLSLLASYEDHKKLIKLSKRKLSGLTVFSFILLIAFCCLEWKYLSSKIYYNLIYYHQRYIGAKSELFFRNNSSWKIYKLVNKYFPETDYRAFKHEIDQIARFGSGLRRNIYYGIALKEKSLGKKSEALYWYKQAETKSPFHNSILYSRCQLEKELGRLTEAVASCEKGTALHPNNPDLHFLLAEVYLEQGSKEKSLLNFKKALALYQTQLNANWVGQSKNYKLNKIKANLKVIEQQIKNLTAQKNVVLSTIQKKILDVPLINKSIAVVAKSVYLASNQSGRYQLWKSDALTSVKQISDDDLDYFNLAYHPGKNRLYFNSDNSGDGHYNIYYRDLNSHQVKNLSKDFSGRSFGDQVISPDGEKIIFIAETKIGQEIQMFDPEGNNLKALTSSKFRKQFLAWHPHSNKFIYVYNNNSLMLYDYTNLKSSELLNSKREFIKDLSFNSSGTQILFSRLDYYGFGRLELLDLKSGKISQLTANKGRYLSPKWLDQSTICFRENLNDEYLLRTLDIYSKKINEIGPTSGVVYDVEFMNSNELIFLHSDLTTPLSLVSYKLKDKTLKRQRFDEISANEVVKPERLQLAIKDKAFPLYIYKPASFESHKKYPLILWLHGTHGAFSPRWHTYAQFFANSDYVFAVVNYDEVLFGSTKLGQTQRTKLQLEAISASLKYLKQNTLVDSTKVFFLGVSQGTNLARNFLLQENYNLAGLIEYSPTSIFRGKRTLPTLVVWGENDPGRRGFSPFRLNDENELILKNEGHDLRQQININERLKQTLGFIENLKKNS